MISGVDAPTPSHREESEAVRPRGNKVYILGHILSGPRIKIDPSFLIWSLVVTLPKDYYIDGQNIQLIFFEKMTTGEGKRPQITPRGWIFWTVIFYNLKKFTSRSI